jgi:molybdate transport system substrate-binding protein
LTRVLNGLAALLFVWGITGWPAAKAADTSSGTRLTVFAAASVRDALDAAAVEYDKKTGHKVVKSYAATSTLAKQIEQGAPADVFISADLDWMNYLVDKKLIETETRTILTGNTLVLIAPAGSKLDLKIDKGFDLAGMLGGGKLVMADIKAVPAGKYGKASLDFLGVWSSVQNQVAQVENVRAALALVARQEATLGIVYQSDASAEPKVKILGTFPENSHPPIAYPVAVVSGSKKASLAREFIAYLKSAAGQEHFIKQGFTVPK